MKSFEIQTMRDGRWGIDSVFNDRELALFEARRVVEGKRYAGVRVIEEVYDEASGLTTTRTIFRGNKNVAQREDKRPPPAKRSGGPSAYSQGTEHERVPRHREPAPARKKSNSLVLVLVMFLLLFMGLAGLLGLNLLSTTIG
jgi:hypothetical protein